MADSVDTEVLDLSVTDISDLKVNTKYCVERSIHEAHVRASCAMGYPSIPAVTSPTEIKTEPVAVVCSGPSLGQSWEEVKGFDKILACSGAHDFLIEHGIIPTWHMETDPRPHKAVFVQKPNPQVQYLIASNCHPEVFKALEGCDIRLWHVLESEEERGVYATFPRDHWVLTGGSNVGLRALIMARILGFVDIHIFGMDCSSGEDYRFHTGFHPNEPKEKSRKTVKVGERLFYTSDVFLEYARQFFKETMSLSDAKFTLHGDGLLQTLASEKFSKPDEIEKRRLEIEKRGEQMIAMMVPSTTSNQYAKLNCELHKERADYGISGSRHAKAILKMYKATNASSLLDYGCGKGLLGRALPFPIWEYDPAIPGKSDPPRPADFVVCTDVLEHVEPEYLDATLMDLARVTLSVAFFVINTKPSVKTLPDGRNTHLIQEGMDWWTEKLSKYFKIGRAVDSPYGLQFIVGKRDN